MGVYQVEEYYVFIERIKLIGTIKERVDTYLNNLQEQGQIDFFEWQEEETSLMIDGFGDENYAEEAEEEVLDIINTK